MQEINPVQPIIQPIIVEAKVEEEPKSIWQAHIEYAKANPLADSEKWILDKIKENKSHYQKAQEWGCDWRILAAIHYRETNLTFTNANNGQGAYQNLANKYVPNSVVTDFTAQTKQACEFIRNKVGGVELKDVNDIDLVGRALAFYNGCENKSFNYCAYTISRINENSKGLTKCAVDFKCWIRSNDNRLGTLTVIAHILANNI